MINKCGHLRPMLIPASRLVIGEQVSKRSSHCVIRCDTLDVYIVVKFTICGLNTFSLFLLVLVNTLYFSSFERDQSPISRMASTQENTESNVYYDIAENRDQIPVYIEVTGDAEYMSLMPPGTPPSNTTVASAPPAGNVMLTPNIANQQLQGSQPPVNPHSHNQPQEIQTTQPQPIHALPYNMSQQGQGAVIQQPQQFQQMPFQPVTVMNTSDAGQNISIQGMAITSILLSAIATVCVLGCLCTIPAIVLGSLALKRSAAAGTGKKFAITSMVLTVTVWIIYVALLLIISISIISIIGG
ncbi:uncharacterized protein [Apostichopus japonicus]|uniref:uncharacterized protein n=1 Tax=Stichopus japonicus TaxID=307972 RepID=UPI003AB467F5